MTGVRSDFCLHPSACNAQGTSDFKTKGVRGSYLKRYRAGINLVLLAPDVASAFPTDKSVNDALRSLIDTAPRARRATR